MEYLREQIIQLFNFESKKKLFSRRSKNCQHSYSTENVDAGYALGVALSLRKSILINLTSVKN